MIVAQFISESLLWLTIPIIILMFFTLLPPFQMIQSKEGYFWVKAFISIYFGWISLAVFANIGSMLVLYEISNQFFSLLLIACAGLMGAYFVTKSKGNLFYLLTLVWGFVGIIIANFLRVENIPAATTAMFFLAIVIISSISVKVR